VATFSLVQPRATQPSEGPSQCQGQEASPAVPARGGGSPVALWGALAVLALAAFVAGGWAWSARPAPVRGPGGGDARETREIAPRTEVRGIAARPIEEVGPPLPGAPEREAEPPPVREDVALPVMTTLDLNTASVAELELLPGIGPAMAKRIVEYRAQIGRFARVDELDKVRGIGPKTLERLRPHVRVQAVGKGSKGTPRERETSPKQPARGP
jgi:competence ComEA-like helix-hairpin-helix protein